MRPSATANPSSRTPPQPMQVLRGIAISPGIAAGPVVVLDRRGLALPTRAVAEESVAGELERLDRGLASARSAVEGDVAEVSERIGPQYAEILSAHARMIADPTLHSDTRNLVERERITAEHAVMEVLEGYAARLERLTGSHLAARAADVRDIEERILGQLVGGRPEPFQDGLAAPTIVLARSAPLRINASSTACTVERVFRRSPSSNGMMPRHPRKPPITFRAYGSTLASHTTTKRPMPRSRKKRRSGSRTEPSTATKVRFSCGAATQRCVRRFVTWSYPALRRPGRRVNSAACAANTTL